MSKPKLVLLALLLLAIGFVVGHFATPAEPAPQAPPTGVAAVAPTPAPKPKGHAALTGEVIRDLLFAVLREPDAFERLPNLAALLSGLGSTAVPEVVAALNQDGIDLSGAEVELLLRFWAQYDPETATGWALFKAPLGFRTGAILVTMEPFARAEPRKAMNQLGALDLARTDTVVTSQIAFVRGWFDSPEPGLLDWVASMGVSVERQRALAAIARKTVQRDGVAGAMRWAESTPDGDATFKQDLYRMLARELARADPAAAVAFCKAHCDGPYGSSLRQFTAAYWSRSDGPAAMAWVATAPAGRERDDAVVAAFEGWFAENRDAVIRWAEELDSEAIATWFQPAIGGLAVWQGGTNAEKGIAWASTINDPALREGTLMTVARNWRNRDQAAADAWLANSPLSEAAIARVVMPLPSGGAGFAGSVPAPEAPAAPPPASDSEPGADAEASPEP